MDTLFAQFAQEVLEIPGVEFRLFPGHEVTTTRKIGKVDKVDLACSPFTRQRNTGVCIPAPVFLISLHRRESNSADIFHASALPNERLLGS